MGSEMCIRDSRIEDLACVRISFPDIHNENNDTFGWCKWQHHLELDQNSDDTLRNQIQQSPETIQKSHGYLSSSILSANTWRKIQSNKGTGKGAKGKGKCQDLAETSVQPMDVFVASWGVDGKHVIAGPVDHIHCDKKDSTKIKNIALWMSSTFYDRLMNLRQSSTNSLVLAEVMLVRLHNNLRGLLSWGESAEAHPFLVGAL